MVRLTAFRCSTGLTAFVGGGSRSVRRLGIKPAARADRSHAHRSDRGRLRRPTEPPSQQESPPNHARNLPVQAWHSRLIGGQFHQQLQVDLNFRTDSLRGITFDEGIIITAAIKEFDDMVNVKIHLKLYPPARGG